MRHAYIGTVKFSYEILKYLIEKGYKPVLVITQKNKGINADYTDLEPLCVSYNIEIIKEDNVNTVDVIAKLKSLDLDYIFCFGWSKLLKKEILEIPKHGVIGYHPAALPKNRGRHPLIWALVLGLEETASTFFFMDEGADSGDILSQKKIEIKYEDDAMSLYNKTIEIAQKQLEEFLPDLEKFSYKRIPQDHSKSNYWRKRTKEDGKIDFRMCSRAIYNLVRGLTRPYVGAHLIYNGNEIKIWKVKELDCVGFENIEPGKVIDVNPSRNSIVIKAYDKCIEIIEHEFETLPKIGDYIS
jgi:methionyl-tRNA formyltransferase